MNVIVAAAIALRAMLHGDYIYLMPVTAVATVITASVNVYPKHQLVGMQYCPSMATTMSSDSSLISSVVQFAAAA